MIAQSSNFLVLKLFDNNDPTSNPSTLGGKWKHGVSYIGDAGTVVLTSWSNEHLAWSWDKSKYGGLFDIGIDSERGSHKEGEERDFQSLVTLQKAKRLANGKFQVASDDGKGEGWLVNNVNPHFTKGVVEWTVTRYER